MTDQNRNLEPSLVEVDNLGEKTATPSSYSLLWWIKSVYTSIVNLTKIMIWDGTNTASVSTSGRLKTESAVRDSNGDLISVQNPLACDGFSVHQNDIWIEQSDMGNFSGEVTDVFNNLHSIVVDDTSNNPKILKIHFKRTTATTILALGSFTGNFSNTRITGEISGPISILLVDESGDSTKKTSDQWDLPPIGFNSLTIEFYTNDTVTLSNVFIAKTSSTVSRIQGLKPDGTVANFQATQSGNFKMSLEEFENNISVNGNSQLKTTSFDSLGNEGQTIIGVDYITGKSGIDSTTETIQIIDYEHHEIHEGEHFNYCDYDLNLAASAIIYFTFQTPNTAKWAHFTFQVSSSAGATIELFEDAIASNDGTLITPRNNNRNSSNTSVVILRKNPTITSIGNRASGFLAGGDRVAGIVGRNKENVLRQNTKYLVKITSLAVSNDISYCSEWYEQINKN